MCITVTESAAARIKHLVNKTDEAVALRISVVGGGCLGMQYSFALETELKQSDAIIEQSDARVVIDPLSQVFVQGSVLDFKKETFVEQFVISNPNVKTTCGCGNSISI